ncbi:hypothetical protein J6W20_01400 [bacterium]|nr:hypothetical protein [bacterium]
MLYKMEPFSAPLTTKPKIQIMIQIAAAKQIPEIKNQKKSGSFFLSVV